MAGARINQMLSITAAPSEAPLLLETPACGRTSRSRNGRNINQLLTVIAGQSICRCPDKEQQQSG